MAAPPFALTFDLSCAFDEPRTGVGYAGVDLVQALAARDDGPELRLFATRPGRAPRSIDQLENVFARECVLPRAGRIKHALWTKLNVPPIEWFTGECAIAHGLFHLVPAASRAKRVVTIHDLSFIRHPEHHTRETVAAHTRLVEHAVRVADHIVTVSETVRGELLETYSGLTEDRVSAVPNGVDVETFGKRSDTAQIERILASVGVTAGRYFIYVGTLEPRKNIEKLIQSFRAAVLEMKEPYKLVLVGKVGWHADDIMRAIDQLESDGLGMHAGRLPRADAITLLQHACACVYPSVYEGFGMPVIEAMAAGTPVIAGDIPVLREVGGDAALYADVEKVEDLAQQIAGLMGNEGTRDDYAQRGPERAREFTWARSATELLNVYNKLV